jgi:serine/threonine protein kinase
LILVLKDSPITRIAGKADNKSSSTKVSINGGTHCYQAPELFKRKAKFSRRADVFAAGVVFLELLTLQKPNSLYDDLYPGILKIKLPAVLLKCFSVTLNPDPAKRIQFTELLEILRSQDGKEMREMELGSPATRLRFDEVAADIRLMMPSSKYNYDISDSSRGNMNSFEIFSQSSNVAPEKTTRNIFGFKRR